MCKKNCACVCICVCVSVAGAPHADMHLTCVIGVVVDIYIYHLQHIILYRIDAIKRSTRKISLKYNNLIRSTDTIHGQCIMLHLLMYLYTIILLKSVCQS